LSSATVSGWTRSRTRCKRSSARLDSWAYLFCTAVHEGQALILDLLGQRPGNHPERRSLIQANWLAVWGPYDHLYQLRREARYECYQPTDKDLNGAMLMLAKFRIEVAAARGT
jgi:hypothetical protein